MKKLLLIPITLTALTPTISMVGCSVPSFNLNKMDKFIDIDVDPYDVLTCEPVSMKSRSRYAVDIDLSNGKPTRQNKRAIDAWFSIVKDLQQEEDENEAIFENAEVGVDDAKLIYESTPSEVPTKDHFAIEQYEEEGIQGCELIIGAYTFTPTSSHVKIIFDIKEIEGTNYYPIFHII